MSMNPEVNELWVTALRSGEYVQGQGTLTALRHQDDGTREVRHCCLGVLCEVALAAGVPLVVDEVGSIDERRVRTYDGEESYLPDRVLSWAGLDARNPLVHRPGGGPAGLAVYNDQLGLSFAEIADMIEEHL